MTVFQAYINEIRNDNLSRIVLTFADSTVADEWWRAINDLPKVAGFFTRINPQFYTHDPANLNVLKFFSDERLQSIAPAFYGRFFMTLIDDRGGRQIPIIRSVPVANALSGNWFFIKSAADPELYWFYNCATKSLAVSRTGRTRFRINATNLPHGKVMIGSDVVRLQVESTFLRVNVEKSSGTLLVNEDSCCSFSFGDLGKGNITFDGHFLKVVNDTSGWKWVLVD